MKKMFFEGLQEYLVNKNIEVYEVLTCKDKEKAKYKLVPVSGNIKESSEIFYFNNADVLLKHLYKNSINEETIGGVGNAVDPFLNKTVSGAELIKAMAKKMLGQEEPKTLGDPGGHGIAFEYKPEKSALKITDDKLEAKNSIELIGKQNNRLVNIYKVYIIKYGNETPQIWYGIIMEYFKDVKLINYLGNNEIWGDIQSIEMPMPIAHRKIKKVIEDKDVVEQIKNAFINFDEDMKDNKKLISKIINSSKVKSIDKIKEIRGKMFDMLVEISQNGFRTNDYTESRNIGIKSSNNKIGFFDLGGDNTGDDKSQNDIFSNTKAKEYKITNPLIK